MPPYAATGSASISDLPIANGPASPSQSRERTWTQYTTKRGTTDPKNPQTRRFWSTFLRRNKPVHDYVSQAKCGNRVPVTAACWKHSWAACVSPASEYTAPSFVHAHFFCDDFPLMDFRMQETRTARSSGDSECRPNVLQTAHHHPHTTLGASAYHRRESHC
jgi:hypothetical protein